MENAQHGGVDAPLTSSGCTKQYNLQGTIYKIHGGGKVKIRGRALKLWAGPYKLLDIFVNLFTSCIILFYLKTPIIK